MKGNIIQGMLKIIRKADIVLFIVLILFGAALAVPAFLWRDSGSVVKITVNGKEFGTYSLSEDKEIVIEKGGHTNKVVIEGGKVRMDYSTCKNQICVHTGKISRSHQSIVCLPKRVSVTIEGKGGEEYDAVSGK